MNNRITFAFLREGTSDDCLIPVLEQLLVEAGATEASGTSLPYRGSSLRKLEQLKASADEFDIVFLHRDADSPVSATVRQEIRFAEEACQIGCPLVKVVPVQEIEAWLLCDESEIRRIAGFPNGRGNLDLPPMRNIEATSSPKEVLKRAYIAAAPLSGARLRRHTTRFPMRRNALIEQLDIHGPVTGLPSWQTLVADIHTALANLRSE